MLWRDELEPKMVPTLEKGIFFTKAWLLRLELTTNQKPLPPLPLAGLQDEPATVIEPLATPYGRTRENLRSKQTLHAPKKFDDYVL